MHRLEEMVRFITLPFESEAQEDTNNPMVSWAEEIAMLEQAFIVQINEIRSAIVREICRLLLNLANLLQESMINMVIVVLPHLGSNFYAAVKLIKTYSEECAKTIITEIPSLRYLPILLDGLDDKHEELRAQFIQFITILLIKKGDDPDWERDQKMGMMVHYRHVDRLPSVI